LSIPYPEIRAVLFDLDGTLTNTLHDIAFAMNRALTLNGLPAWPEDAYRYLVGDGAKKLAERAVREHTDMQAKVLNDYQQYYQEHACDTTRPYDGVPEMLDRLHAMGLKLCVFSNKPHQDTLTVVRRYFPDVPFDVVRGQVEGVPVKPDPAGALLAARSAGVEPARFLYLGDTATDMRCARNAGMTPVGVLWGFRDEKELIENGAARVIARPEELFDGWQ